LLLDQKLGGGIPLGSLARIEGVTSAGKSVLCQHFTNGALRVGPYVAYFTSENDIRSLVIQMESIGVNVSSYLGADRLRINPLNLTVSGEDAGSLLIEATKKIESLPRKYKVIIVDSITNLVTQGEEKEWSAALEEEVQRLEKIITDLHKEITWRELEIGPPAQWRGSNYSPN